MVFQRGRGCPGGRQSKSAMPYLAARAGSNQPEVLHGIMTVDMAMSHVGCHGLGCSIQGGA